ncbi:hypothetical protein GGD81_002074 [Rhodobium orientis]|nr:hypothetical protein [Rhodobium orientis]
MASRDAEPFEPDPDHAGEGTGRMHGLCGHLLTSVILVEVSPMSDFSLFSARFPRRRARRDRA